MKTELVTEHNMEYAIAIQEELFPGESARTNIGESLEPGSWLEYYLLYEGRSCAGIIGLYRYAEDPDSAWLGWFGIRDAFRRRHLGTEAIRFFEELARSKGYRFARLYTDAEQNDAAIAFYRANGYTEEPYRNPEDPAGMDIPVLIFSKSLGKEELVPWNSRSIHLTEQIEKQERGERQKKKSGAML